MLAAAQKAAADAAQNAPAIVGAPVNHPATPTAHTDTSRQATPNINDDVNMSGGAGSDIFAMLISRPTTPTPPVSIMDDVGARRLCRSVDADAIFHTSMADISARVAAIAAADVNTIANGIDVDMTTPGSTPQAVRTAANLSTDRVIPSMAFDAAPSHAAPSSATVADVARSNAFSTNDTLNHTRVGAAPNTPNLTVNFTIAGAAVGSSIIPGARADSSIVGGAAGLNIAGGGAGLNIADGAAGPSVAGGGIVNNDPPPPYSGPTNALPVAQTSRSRLASSHSRRRGGRVAAAAASARANQPGSSRNPISIDD